MDNSKLVSSGIVGMGVLATSLIIGAEMPTNATLLNSELNTSFESHNELVLGNYTDYLKNYPLFSFQYDGTKIDTDVYEDNYPEIEVIEVPVFKKMLFQFNKPVKLEFS